MPIPALRNLLAFLALFIAGCSHYEYDLTAPVDLAQHIGTKSDTTFTIDPLEYRLRSYEDHLVLRIYNPTDDPVQLVGAQSSVVDPHSQSHPLRSSTIESHSFVKLILPPPLYASPYGPEYGFADDKGDSEHSFSPQFAADSASELAAKPAHAQINSRPPSSVVLVSAHGGGGGRISGAGRMSGAQHADFHRFHHRVFISGGFWYDPWYYDPWYDEPRYYVLYDGNDQAYWDWRGDGSVRLALTFQRKDKTFRDEFEFKRMKVQG